MHKILVRRKGNLYSALADDLKDPLNPIVVSEGTEEEVIASLRAGGWHQQDIGDALNDADSDWEKNQLP